MKVGGYVGRFAPSPTGRLHMGSLLAAVASWCDARHAEGVWRVRMEDLDPPREIPGAADDILRTLEGFGLHWDGPVVYQSHRYPAYAEALARLQANGRAFGCACSRKTLQGHAVYPGYCRSGLGPGAVPRSHRFVVGSEQGEWTDEVQGRCRWDSREMGDFVIKRADGFWAYQLAVVVDDLDQGVNAVVRGSDLLDSTPRQLALRKALDPAAPGIWWSHLPLLVNAEGQKLSKQTLASPIEVGEAPDLVLTALQMLGQIESGDGEPRDLADSGNTQGLLEWAARHWQLRQVAPAPIHWQG